MNELSKPIVSVWHFFTGFFREDQGKPSMGRLATLAWLLLAWEYLAGNAKPEPIILIIFGLITVFQKSAPGVLDVFKMWIGKHD